MLKIILYFNLGGRQTKLDQPFYNEGEFYNKKAGQFVQKNSTVSVLLHGNVSGFLCTHRSGDAHDGIVQNRFLAIILLLLSYKLKSMQGTFFFYRTLAEASDT